MAAFDILVRYRMVAVFIPVPDSYRGTRTDNRLTCMLTMLACTLWTELALRLFSSKFSPCSISFSDCTRFVLVPAILDEVCWNFCTVNGVVTGFPKLLRELPKLEEVASIA